jgi:RNA polymerase sigma-70 factor (ECF subfamily)
MRLSLEARRPQLMSRAIVAISLEEADENQAENAAIALGLKRQDLELVDYLIDLYQHRLMRYLLFLTRKHEIAEDLFQETWMRVLLRGNQYNGKARFDTWLFTIARNLAIDLSRKGSSLSLDEISTTTDGVDGFELVSNTLSPFETFQFCEDRAEVAEALSKIGGNYHEVLVLRFQEEMSLEEIARAMHTHFRQLNRGFIGASAY